MDFKPMTEEEAAAAGLLPNDAEYDFEVLYAEDKTSKAGNEMIEIKVGIYTTDKIGVKIKDWLLPSMGPKLRHFCDTVGLLSAYESGTLNAEMCVGRSGRCRVGIKKQDGYHDKNMVKDYICRPAKPLRDEILDDVAVGDNNDDVPF